MGINDEKTQRSFCRFRRRLIEIDLHNRVSSNSGMTFEFANMPNSLGTLVHILEFDCIHKPRAISVIYTP